MTDGDMQVVHIDSLRRPPVNEVYWWGQFAHYVSTQSAYADPRGEWPIFFQVPLQRQRALLKRVNG